MQEAKSLGFRTTRTTRLVRVLTRLGFCRLARHARDTPKFTTVSDLQACLVSFPSSILMRSGMCFIAHAMTVAFVADRAQKYYSLACKPIRWPASECPFRHPIVGNGNSVLSCPGLRGLKAMLSIFFARMISRA